WIRHPKGNLDDGREVTFELFDRMLDEEMEKIKSFVGEEEFSKGTYEAAARVFDDLVKSDTFEEFLTLPAYGQLLKGRKETTDNLVSINYKKSRIIIEDGKGLNDLIQQKMLYA